MSAGQPPISSTAFSVAGGVSGSFLRVEWLGVEACVRRTHTHARARTHTTHTHTHTHTADALVFGQVMIMMVVIR